MFQHIEREKKMKKMLLCVLGLLMIIGIYGLGTSRLFSEEKILARVGNRTITQADLAELIKNYESMSKGRASSPEAKKELFDLLIKRTLISIGAEREKLDQTPEFQSKMRIVKNELLAREYISKKIEPFVTVKNEEVDEILKKNPNLIPKERLSLKEISVKTEKEAQEIYQDLKKGADFSKIAMEKSISRTKTKGGLMGEIVKGQLPPPAETAVYNLKEGEFTQPIKTNEGFQIFYSVSKKEIDPQRLKTLEASVRVKITQMEKNKKIEALLEKKIEELKKEIKVETYLDRLQ